MSMDELQIGAGTPDNSEPKTVTHEELAREAARNPNTSAIILAKLALDKDVYIRRRVAENPSCPATVLNMLARDNDIYTSIIVAGHPNATAETLGYVAEFINSRVNSDVASSSRVSIAVMDKLALRAVLVLLAQHKNTPIHTLSILATGLDSAIALYARENLQNRAKEK